LHLLASFQLPHALNYAFTLIWFRYYTQDKD
jgi:hypothetical protein